MKLKNKLLIIGIVGILCGLIVLLFCTVFLKGKVDNTISYSEDFTEFDNYLMDIVGIKATPAHIIIKNGKVTNYIDETVSYTELEKLRNDDIYNIDVWKKEITQNIYMKDYDLIIVKKQNCSACEYQDIYYAKTIFANYKNLNILIYWINTIDEGCLNGCN